MSEEQLKAFLEKIKADTSLQEEFLKASTPDEAQMVAKKAGFSIVAAEFQSMIDDAELEAAAGGGWGNYLKVTITGVLNQENRSDTYNHFGYTPSSCSRSN